MKIFWVNKVELVKKKRPVVKTIGFVSTFAWEGEQSGVVKALHKYPHQVTPFNLQLSEVASFERTRRR